MGGVMEFCFVLENRLNIFILKSYFERNPNVYLVKFNVNDTIDTYNNTYHTKKGDLENEIGF